MTAPDYSRDDDNDIEAHHQSAPHRRSSSLLRRQSTLLQKQSTLAEDFNAAFDDQVVNKAIADAGQWAHGIVMVEVWLLSDDRAFLFRPNFGFWIDPIYLGSEQEKLGRLADPSRSDYMPPSPVVPGEGLPGCLWAESSRLSGGASAGVLFRDVNQISNDPDQPFDPRLRLISKLGLGWAAAVPIKHGIIIYLARKGVSQQQLRSSTNQDYLVSASELIGAAFRLRKHRRAVELERKEQVAKAFRRLRVKITALVAMGIKLTEQVQQESQNDQLDKQTISSTGSFLWSQIMSRIRMAIQKTRGGGGTAPPGFDWQQSGFSFVGVFLMMAMITNFNRFVQSAFGTAISLGPFGSLATLLFGLTAAPAAQPRNTIIGQTIGITIAIAVGYATVLPLWFRQSLAAALSVAFMTKLGVTHPPAGASAVVFATGLFGWGSLLAMTVGSLMAVVAASLINNLSYKRQYPIYWGVAEIESLLLVKDRIMRAERREASKLSLFHQRISKACWARNNNNNNKGAADRGKVIIDATNDASDCDNF